MWRTSNTTADFGPAIAEASKAHIDEQQLRLTVRARRGKAKELVDAG
jgi:hypothetical protein